MRQILPTIPRLSVSNILTTDNLSRQEIDDVIAYLATLAPSQHK